MTKPAIIQRSRKIKTLIVYASFHHHNTKKVATAINDVLQGEMVDYSAVSEQQITDADLIGFGSGVYYAKFHKALIKLVRNLPEMNNKNAFIFSTSGVGENFLFNRAHKHFRDLLKAKKFTVLDEFDCRGYDTYGLLKYIGGVKKGKPDAEDLEAAKKFAGRLSEY